MGSPVRGLCTTGRTPTCRCALLPAAEVSSNPELSFNFRVILVLKNIQYVTRGVSRLLALTSVWQELFLVLSTDATLLRIARF